MTRSYIATITISRWHEDPAERVEREETLTIGTTPDISYACDLLATAVYESDLADGESITRIVLEVKR
jgi:hypothetical protein